MWKIATTGMLRFCGILALFLLVAPMTALGQQGRTLNIGALEYFTNEIMSADDMNWPRGVRHMAPEMLDTYGITVGLRRTWTAPDGQTYNVQVAQVMQNKFSDIENVTVPVSGAFKRVHRNPYPTKQLDGVNWTQTFDQNDPVDPTIPSDAMIYTAIDLWPNANPRMDIRVERWAYVFANDDYDDMIIMEYRISNTGSQTAEDVVIGLNAAVHSEAHYPGDLWGDYYGATYPRYVGGDASADSLRMWYAWRADMSSSGDQDDTGDPHSQWGYFQEPQFMGHIVLHADASASDESDDPNQPFKAGWSQRDKVKNLNEASQTEVYNFLANSWDVPDYPYDTFYDSDRNPSTRENGYFRVLEKEPGKVAPYGIDLYSFDSEQEQEKNGFFSFGPYTLAPGEDVRIVTAFVGGVIPSRLAIDAGRAWDGGFEGRPVFGVCDLYVANQAVPCNNMPGPLSYSDMHGHPIVQSGDVYGLEFDPVNGGLKVTEAPMVPGGNTLTKTQKDDIIYLGQKLMFETASMAKRVWDSGNVKYGQGTFNIPYAPAAPSLVGFSENDQIRLQWSDNTQDNSRGGTITGWRVYREYKRPPALTSPYDTTFIRIADLPVSQTEYVDTDVVRGEDYYYYVVAVNDQGIESSPFQNRTGTSANKEDEALAPTRAPAETWRSEDPLEGVVVVPNPYHVQAAQKYPGKRLNFLNLPAYANVHIYTMTGDRIQTLEHDANTGDIDWERQDTFSTMEIVSGVYLYVVEELDGPRGNPTGRTAIGKFVVIK